MRKFLIVKLISNYLSCLEFISEIKSMQLIALDRDNSLSAAQADKGKDYICPECSSPVRLRGGPSRQDHFFHLAKQSQCRQHEKSQEHIHLQMRLCALTDGQMECPFPSISRIADVAWHNRKLVFEIQCSPISLEEAKTRTSDYRSAGYEVVWILHDKRFNAKNLSAAEHFLRTTACYFSNVDAKGNGIVYDQFDVIKDNRRLFKGPPLELDPSKITRMPQAASPDIPLPHALLYRLANWKCLAEKDLLHRLLREGSLSASSKKMLVIEKRLLEEKPANERLPLKKLITGTYTALLEILLSKLAKKSR
ncbi:MAG: hypothetical protein HYX67_08330 [Candidatus Melainabacteria bacterium]|nr:hypothetical protein [Candidatus Melainabacteria bacterium]